VHPNFASLLLAGALAITNQVVSPPAPPIPLPGPSGWARTVDHPYYPLRPGTVLAYTTIEGSRAGTDTVTVLRETRTIMGITATVVRDRSYQGGLLVEDSVDWFAQDAAGNVWCLGEDTREYRAGRVTSTAGSWEAGKSLAQPGIVMWAVPRVGVDYRQEFRRGVAEDMARVLAVTARTTVGAVTYEPCVHTEEWSPLERGTRERKFYARGVGLVRMQSALGPREEMTLVRVVTP